MLALELRRAETSCQSRARSVPESGWLDWGLEAGTISSERVDARGACGCVPRSCEVKRQEQTLLSPLGTGSPVAGSNWVGTHSTLARGHGYGAGSDV